MLYQGKSNYRINLFSETSIIHLILSFKDGFLVYLLGQLKDFSILFLDHRFV